MSMTRDHTGGDELSFVTVMDSDLVSLDSSDLTHLFVTKVPETTPRNATIQFPLGLVVRS